MRTANAIVKGARIKGAVTYKETRSAITSAVGKSLADKGFKLDKSNPLAKLDKKNDCFVCREFEQIAAPVNKDDFQLDVELGF